MIQAHQGKKAQIRAVPVRPQRPPVGERAGRMGGVLQALRTVWPLGKEEPQRCDSGVERHDFGEKEGANQWTRSNALSWNTRAAAREET